MRFRWRRAARAVALAGAALALAGPARAATVTVTQTATAADPNTPVLVTDTTHPPPGYRLTAQTVETIAARSPTARAELRRHPKLIPYEYTKGPGRWQVSWFTAPPHQRELLQIYVSDATGRVTEAWTGFQVAWTMARGYPGAFGRIVNAWWIWVPLCLVFLVPFLPLRPLRRPTLLHLDLLVLLGFSISLAFFNHARIGLSVPLTYPFLLYLLVRLLGLGFGRGRPREPLRLLVPVPWLAVAVVFLIGFRVGLNIVNSNVIDVGYAGVIGATKILHGHALYGHWPSDNAYGDTYAPLNYLAYIPFRAIFGWSGVWDDLPAAHAAAIAFDLLTLIGLFLLGRRVRGNALGVVLAYAWAAYPFTLYALSSNSNDALVSALVVLALLTLRSAPARGAAAALAGLTKFAPLALAPLMLRGTGPRLPRPRRAAAFALAFALTAAALMAYVVAHDNLPAFWKDTIVYQEGRGSPFSIWGLWGGLSFEQHLVQGAAVALVLVLAVVPRRRGLVEVAALAGAILIALQLGLTHWFYLYIPWFFAPAIVALLGARPRIEAVLPGERVRPAAVASSAPVVAPTAAP
jgi:hypothetical protein